MPKIRGMSSRQERERSSAPAAVLRSMKRVATPETRNSNDSRQGLSASISGSSAAMVGTLLMCQFQGT